MQDRSAGHEDLDGWTSQEQFHQRRRGLDDLLKIIQQQQEVFITQEGFERLEQRTFLGISQAQRLCDGGHDQLSVAERSKLYLADAMKKYLAQIRRDFLSQACLADAGGSPEGEGLGPRPEQLRTDRRM